MACNQIEYELVGRNELVNANQPVTVEISERRPRYQSFRGRASLSLAFTGDSAFLSDKHTALTSAYVGTTAPHFWWETFRAAPNYGCQDFTSPNLCAIAVPEARQRPVKMTD